MESNWRPCRIPSRRAVAIGRPRRSVRVATLSACRISPTRFPTAPSAGGPCSRASRHTSTRTHRARAWVSACCAAPAPRRPAGFRPTRSVPPPTRRRGAHGAGMRFGSASSERRRAPARARGAAGTPPPRTRPSLKMRRPGRPPSPDRRRRRKARRGPERRLSSPAGRRGMGSPRRLARDAGPRRSCVAPWSGSTAAMSGARSPA